MATQTFRGIGAEGWDITWLQLFGALCDAVHCRSATDDERGTGANFLKTVVEAAVEWNARELSALTIPSDQSRRIICVSGRPRSA